MNLDLKSQFKKLLPIIFIMLLEIMLPYIFVQEMLFWQTRSEIKGLNERIQSDLKYVDGKWDTTQYNSDPLTPYPNASSSFPIYIITTDGFVIERSKPISGFLDTSDFKHLRDFTTPTTLNSLTNENWRVYSKLLFENDEPIGLITVSYYNPETNLMDEIDSRLVENSGVIFNSLKIENGQIDTSNLDIRNIHYSVSFEVVNKFNSVVINNGRTPSFLDSSYVKKQLESEQLQEIEDNLSKEQFLVYSHPIYDENNVAKAIVIVGKTINPIEDILNYFLISSSITTFLIGLPLMFFVRKKYFNLYSNASETIVNEEEKLPKSIHFDIENGFLFIDENEVKIPYDSNQYFICKSMFSSPNKRWDQDELLEEMGDDISANNSRKIYDAVIAINKKAGIKLISYSGKIYRISKELLPRIK